MGDWPPEYALQTQPPYLTLHYLEVAPEPRAVQLRIRANCKRIAELEAAARRLQLELQVVEPNFEVPLAYGLGGAHETKISQPRDRSPVRLLLLILRGLRIGGPGLCGFNRGRTHLGDSWLGRLELGCGGDADTRSRSGVERTRIGRDGPAAGGPGRL